MIAATSSGAPARQPGRSSAVPSASRTSLPHPVSSRVPGSRPTAAQASVRDLAPRRVMSAGPASGEIDVDRVTESRGDACRTVAEAGHPDGRALRPRAARDDLGVVGVVELAFVGDRSLAQQTRHDLHRLGVAGDGPFGRVAEGSPRGIALRHPRSEAQDQPAAADLVERHRHLGQQGRVPEAGARDVRPDANAGRGLGCRGKDRPALPEAEPLAAGQLAPEMVGHPDRVDAHRLGLERDAAYLRPARV